jgi:spermidine synthase
MNTTYHWRDHSTNLLSTDFLAIVRHHLNPGGVFFYNTTDSKEVDGHWPGCLPRRSAV